MDTSDLLALIPDGHYDPSEVVLIGAHLHPSPNVPAARTADGKLKFDIDDEAAKSLAEGTMKVNSDFTKTLKLIAVALENADGDRTTTPTVALIYAYGDEGHCYRLGKPRIMIVEGHGEPFNPEGDIKESLTGQLFMWRQAKHEQTVSIEVESGSLEQLVLEANLPGNRSVSAYGAHMQMSHRGGKIG